MKKIIALILSLFCLCNICFADTLSPTLPAIEDPVLDAAAFLDIECIDLGETIIPTNMHHVIPTNIHCYLVHYPKDEEGLILTCIQPNSPIAHVYQFADEIDMAQILVAIITVHLNEHIPAYVEWNELKLTEWNIANVVQYLVALSTVPEDII